jgi:CheY-like chemotaxis protein
MIVDDDARLLEGLRIVLEAAGAVVATARSAAEAYGYLEHAAVDLLLSDIGMPGEDGYSLVRRMRAAPGAMRRIPAIAITALRGEDSRVRALAAGFDRLLAKPIDLPRLIANIAELV